MDQFALINLVAGICILLFGVEIVGDELQGVASGKFRHFLSTFTSNPLKGALAGIGVTAFVQSSTVTSVILVTFVNAGVMTLRQSIGVILGADIGGTITVQLIAFRVFDYALLLVAFGLIAKFSNRGHVAQFIGNFILGIGFIFFSIQLMSQSFKPLGQNELFQQVLTALSHAPIYGIILAAAFTALVHSSAVSIGITIAMAMNQLITLPEAMPIILGANIGTCATALITSLGTSPDAKRIAMVNVVVKATGIILMYPFMVRYAELIRYATGEDIARQIANAHTIFNVLLATLFLPFTGVLARLSRNLIPDKATGEEAFKAKYLDENLLSNPTLALGESVRESLRMMDIAEKMLANSIRAFDKTDENLIRDISREDDKLDFLEHAIKIYITDMMPIRHLTPEQSRRQIMILSVVMNLENIGDIVDKNLMDLAHKKLRLGVHFSEAGWKEIQQLHKQVLENFEMVITAFTIQDGELAKKVIQNKQEISQLERSLRQAHIERLQKGLKESIETSEIHLDILTHLKRVNSHITAIAYTLVE
jgi:phosphate:Na+ symporter